MMEHIHQLKHDRDSGASTEEIYRHELFLKTMWMEFLVDFELDPSKGDWWIPEEKWD